MKKQTFIEEMNMHLLPHGLCVDYYNAGSNPQYHIMKCKEDNQPLDYFAGHVVWQTNKKQEVDAYVTGVSQVMHLNQL